MLTSANWLKEREMKKMIVALSGMVVAERDRLGWRQQRLSASKDGGISG